MKKAIYTEGSGKIQRILSIADVEAVTVSPNGMEYVEVEYVEPPILSSCLDTAYPMYDASVKKMYWTIVHYQEAASAMVLANEQLKAKIEELEGQLEETQEALDVVLMGGAEDGEVSGGEN